MFGNKSIKFGERSYRIEGDLDDPYFQNLERVAIAQAPLEGWIRANLPRDAVVIDAGGNIGITTLLLCTLLPAGYVHVFEALPSNALHLRRNIAANGIANCTVNATALGDRPGAITMQGTGSSSHVAAGGASGSIPMVTLDDYAADAKLDRLDFIKIDVEGFEPAVLDGGRKIIERFAPPILMEFNSWCLTFLQGYDTSRFASEIWDTFDVRSLEVSGREIPIGDGSVMRFLHDNVVLHGAVEDVLLRLKPGVVMPATASLARPFQRGDATEEIMWLRAEIDAVCRSTSWRVTKPLRTLTTYAQKFALRR